MKIINLEVIRKDQQGNEYWWCTINGRIARLKTSNGSELVDLIINNHSHSDTVANETVQALHTTCKRKATETTCECGILCKCIQTFTCLLMYWKKDSANSVCFHDSMPQQARQSKYEREKTEFVVSAYYDYRTRTQLITRKEFLKKVCHRYGPRTDSI